MKLEFNFINSDHMIMNIMSIYFLTNCTKPPSGPGPSHYRVFTITFKHTTLGRNPLDEWSARRRDLYLTTHSTHKKQISMSPARFEPAIAARKRPRTHALVSAATGIGYFSLYLPIFWTHVMEAVGIKRHGMTGGYKLRRRRPEMIQTSKNSCSYTIAWCLTRHRRRISFP